MTDKKPSDSDKESKAGEPLPVGDLEVGPCEDTNVEYRSELPKGPEREIHDRRKAPPVPDRKDETSR